LFDRLASRGALDVGLMPPLASTIGQFHLAAERRRDHGGRNGVAWVVDGNAAGFAEEGTGILDAALAAGLTNHSRALLARHAPELDRRRDAGFVRQCHGDLHLRNIALIDGRPTPFDGIEFNDEIACIDVLYDLAFLLMDLWRRQLPQHANVVLNNYLAVTRDFEGLRLLPLFLSLRSAVRAKTSATAARLQTDSQRRAELEETARGYLTLATTLLQAPPACLIAIGGFSGSGKSTLARTLAPSHGAVPGAVVVRSDEVRKQLCGVDLLTRLGPSGYRAPVTRRVYETLAERAAQIVSAGHCAIVDAVFARRGDRDAIERVAVAAGVPFVGIWLDAPQETLVGRTCRREQDASDADAAVVRFQLAQEAGEIVWHRIPALAEPAVVRERAAGLLDAHLATPGLAGVRST
jgi:predicted kinase